ncbi:MAG: FAD-dependent oxidoreductase, partial [Microcystaceae cyanobacterium]
MTVTKEHPHIAIAGGGFGGLYTALRLSQLPWDATCTPQITLIDQRDRFLFAPFLYELITGEMQTWEIAPPFEELLSGTGIRFQQSQVIGWDGEQQQIFLSGA